MFFSSFTVTLVLTGACQDDKKKDTDVEMKVDDVADKHGDVSPLSGSISNLPESSNVPEPNFQKLPNFSRVTPSQMAYVTFPSDCRYQPVRAVSAHPPRKGQATPSALVNLEKFGGGGGILILADQHPDQPPEYIEFTTQGTGSQVEPDPASTHRHIALDENAPEADPPEPFEVRVPCILIRFTLTIRYLYSTHLSKTHKAMLTCRLHSVTGLFAQCFLSPSPSAQRDHNDGI